ncbi:hypothetical protein ACKH85_004547, partial [Shigella flexneri]
PDAHVSGAMPGLFIRTSRGMHRGN